MIAIDPGKSGGIAWIEDEVVHACNMPKTMTGIIDKFIELKTICKSCVVEKTGGYRPGNSGPASVKFARHCGNIEAALYAIGIPFDEVTAAVWQRKLATFSKDKKERKNQIKEMMQRKYPHLKVTLLTADALGILTASRD